MTIEDVPADRKYDGHQIQDELPEIYENKNQEDMGAKWIFLLADEVTDVSDVP